MARLHIITGRPGVGKTTIVMRVVQLLLQEGISVGGMYTRELRVGGVREGFELVDVASNRKGVLAHVGLKNGPRVGRYVVNISDLESLGVAVIRDSLANKDVTVVDEVGPMELKSSLFRDVVDELISTNSLAVVTAHQSVFDQLTGRSSGSILHFVKEDNREILPSLVANSVMEELARSERGRTQPRL